MEPWFSEHLSSATLRESSSKIIIQFKQEDTLSINSWFPDVLTLQQSKYDLKTFWKTLIWLSKVGQEEERNNPSSQMKQRHLRLKRLVAIFLEIQQKAQSRLCCKQPGVFLFFSFAAISINQDYYVIFSCEYQPITAQYLSPSVDAGASL